MMKVEIKNIKVDKKCSEETNCFTADIHVNGKKAGYAKNLGRGGNTEYRAYQGYERQIQSADAYLRSLPSTPFTYGNVTVQLDSSLERFIDEAVENSL